MITPFVNWRYEKAAENGFPILKHIVLVLLFFTTFQVAMLLAENNKQIYTNEKCKQF